MQILFLPPPTDRPHWFDNFQAALDGRHEIKIYDNTLPIADQFRGIDIVVDNGGYQLEMVDAAVDAGVKLWQLIAAGVDHWNVPYFLERGMLLANTPGPFSAIALAEHALLLMLVIAKNFPASQHNMQSQVLGLPLNDELAGTTLGIIGLGASGTALAQRASALDMEIMAIDTAPIPQTKVDALHLRFAGTADDLEHVLRQADYISLHTPNTASTRRLINEKSLAMMKPNAVLINVARGELIDEDALLHALRTGQIRAAGLDAFMQEPLDPAHPLMQLENVICTPHIAGVTRETARRRGEAAAANIKRVAQGLPPLYQIKDAE